MRELSITDVDPSDLDGIAGGNLDSWVIDTLIGWSNGGGQGCASNCQPPEGYYLEIYRPEVKEEVCSYLIGTDSRVITVFGILTAADC